MGSSCSVAPSSNNVGNLYKPANGDATSPTRISESAKTQLLIEEVSEEFIFGTLNQEQPSTSTAGPSFSWLMSSPVVSQTTD